MARDYIARADYRSALSFLRSALRGLEKEPASSIDRAYCYIELARCYNLQGEAEGAAYYAQWALNLLRNVWGAEIAEADARLELGLANMQVGNWRKAERLLVDAYDAFAKHQMWGKAAKCVENIGLLAKQQGQIVRAINALSFARRLYQQIEDMDRIRRTEQLLRELITED
jgi:tetratricopeptide (TPR) repeat protein